MYKHESKTSGEIWFECSIEEILTGSSVRAKWTGLWADDVHVGDAVVVLSAVDVVDQSADDEDVVDVDDVDDVVVVVDRANDDDVEDGVEVEVEDDSDGACWVVDVAAWGVELVNAVVVVDESDAIEVNCEAM